MFDWNNVEKRREQAEWLKKELCGKAIMTKEPVNKPVMELIDKSFGLEPEKPPITCEQFRKILGDDPETQRGTWHDKFTVEEIHGLPQKKDPETQPEKHEVCSECGYVYPDFPAHHHCSLRKTQSEFIDKAYQPIGNHNLPEEREADLRKELADLKKRVEALEKHLSWKKFMGAK